MFPVPDGDTGTNMLATVRAALEEADKAGPDADADRVAHAASFGALMGARGNSGVITSQILAGIAHGLQGKKRFNGLDLAHALDAGTKTAYKAVAKPVEGTILTVIREASAAAVAAAERDNNVETVLAATVDAAERAVAKTPSLLPILREAHVVDSGGQGLLRMFQGALEAARGRPVDAAAVDAAAARAARRDRAPDGSRRARRRDRRVRLRDGVPAPRPRRHPARHPGDPAPPRGDRRLGARRGRRRAGQDPRPQRPARLGHRLRPLDRDAAAGSRSRTSTARRTTSARRRRARSSPRAAAASASAATAVATGGARRARDRRRRRRAVPARRRLPLGIVAVVPSDGLAALFDEHAAGFREFVAVRIVRGGQSANPSTGELLEAVEATPADELLILPNNPNVILAARQVASMTDRPIHVVPTRNCAEGFAVAARARPVGRRSPRTCAR